MGKVVICDNDICDTSCGCIVNPVSASGLVYDRIADKFPNIRTAYESYGRLGNGWKLGQLHQFTSRGKTIFNYCMSSNLGVTRRDLYYLFIELFYELELASCREVAMPRIYGDDSIIFDIISKCIRGYDVSLNLHEVKGV